MEDGDGASEGPLDRIYRAEWKLKLLLALVAEIAERGGERFTLSADELTGLHLLLAEGVEALEEARSADPPPVSRDPGGPNLRPVS